MADTNGKRPWGRNLHDFTDANLNGLRPAERQLLDCAQTGERCRIGKKRPKKPTDDNTIRPDFLRFLALGGDVAAPVHENGIQLFGAYIDGALDLNHCHVPVPLLLANCWLNGHLEVRHATTGLIILQGSHIQCLDGDGLTTHGDLFLRADFQATGEVRLVGAEIGGDLSCRNAKLQNPDGNALSADRLNTSGDVFLDNGFYGIGEMRLLGANIGGNLSCRNGTFEDLNGTALRADGVTTSGDVLLNNKIRANGEVRLVDAKVGGNVRCEDGKFKNEGHSAIIGDRLQTTGNVLMRDNFYALGAVRIRGGNIGGNLVCSGGFFKNPNSAALSANGLRVGGNIKLDHKFFADGKVRLRGANVGDTLDCSNGTFQNPDGEALNAERIEVGGNVVFADYFVAWGEVRLCSARIQNSAVFRNGTFLRPIPTDKSQTFCRNAINIEQAVIARTFVLNLVAIWGAIDISFAYAGVLEDYLSRGTQRTGCAADLQGLFCHISFDGFAYDRIGSGSSIDARARLRWLERQPDRDLNEDFKPQPYEQLASVLRRLGHERDAEKIFIAKKHRERCGEFKKPHSILRYFNPRIWVEVVFLDKLIGYGYRVHRALWTALAVWIISAFVFYQAAHEGMMVPTSPRVFLAEDFKEACAGENWTTCDADRMRKEHTSFQPIVYTLDVLLPFAPLGQESAWEPAISNEVEFSGETLVVSGWLPVVVMWIDVLFGWIVGLLIAAVVSGVVKRE